MSEGRAARLLNSPLCFAGHWALSVLPAGLHRTVTDWPYAWDRLRSLVTRPIRLYFKAEVREQWMREMVDDGLAHGMLTEQEAATIRAQLSERFIQKYLQSLAVHVCTLPVTQIVSGALALAGVLIHPEWSAAQAWAYALAVLALFQIIPISPGSLTRGLYVVYLVIRERNYRDYKLAVWMGFWKYIGYLSFPLQMAYRYPAIARFMAGRWATGAVHILPVFGERGALAEHAVFDLFYNRPLSIRRKLLRRAERRRGLSARHWHVPVVAATAVLVGASLPGAENSHGHLILLAMLAGTVASLLGRGAQAARRILLGGAAGLLVGLGRMALELSSHAGGPDAPGRGAALLALLLPAFGGTLLALLSAALAELAGPEPHDDSAEKRDRPLTPERLRRTMVRK